MEDRLLVEALRERDPAAIGAVYDDYADRLYAYCWFQLRNGDAAQVAVRDTLMCAEAHIHRLRTPARLGPWLYALARIECRRRRPSGPVRPDIPIATHDQHDVDLRLLVWRAVSALPPLSRELLDLRHRHDLALDDVAGVVGLPARQVRDLLGRAQVLLEAALIAEILAHDAPFVCAGRTAVLRHRGDEIDDDLREALVRHSLDCRVCARHLPDSVSAAKVYSLLPRARPPERLRAVVMTCFTDPELAGYRLFAAARLTGFGARGFPEQPGAGRAAASSRRGRRWLQALGAMTGAVLAAMAATTVCGRLGDGVAPGTPVIAGGPPHAGTPSPSPGPPDAGRPVSAAFPLASREPPAPPIALGGSPSPHFLAAPGTGGLWIAPGRLTLGPGGTGTIIVRAVGAPVEWQASATGAVRLTPGWGALNEGGAQAVTVQAPGHGPGRGVITFRPGGAQLLVTWGAGRPSSPPPTPAPTCATPPPTPMPSPTPTDSPPPSTPPPPGPQPTTAPTTTTTTPTTTRPATSAPPPAPPPRATRHAPAPPPAAAAPSPTPSGPPPPAPAGPGG